MVTGLVFCSSRTLTHKRASIDNHRSGAHVLPASVRVRARNRTMCDFVQKGWCVRRALKNWSLLSHAFKTVETIAIQPS